MLQSRVASALRPKVGVCLAPTLAAFVPTLPITNPADLGGVVIHQGIHMFAFLLQFVVSPAFLIGATVSYLRRSRSIRLFEDHRTANGPSVSSLTWRQFEELVGEGFRQRGCQVTENEGAAPDGGVDLLLTRGN